jgi:hypothetical protein
VASQDSALIKRIQQVKDYTTICIAAPSEVLAPYSVHHILTHSYNIFPRYSIHSTVCTAHHTLQYPLTVSSLGTSHHTLYSPYTILIIHYTHKVLATIAVRNADLLLARNRCIVEEGKAEVEDFFRQHRDDFTWARPQAGTFAFPRFCSERLSSREYCDGLVEHAGILLCTHTVYSYCVLILCAHTVYHYTHHLILQVFC